MASLLSKRSHDDDFSQPASKVFVVTQKGKSQVLPVNASDEHQHSLNKTDYVSLNNGDDSLYMDSDDCGEIYWDEIVWILDEKNVPLEESVDSGVIPIRDIEQKVLLSTKGSVNYQKQLYFGKLKNAFLSRNFSLVLDHLRASPIIGYVFTELASFINSQLKENKEAEGTLILLHAIHCLISNDYALPAGYVYILTEEDSLVSCLVDPMLRCNLDSHCFLIKDIAADILSELFDKDPSLKLWNAAFSKLCRSCNDLKSYFIVHYGAIVTSLSIGIEAIVKFVFPCLEVYCIHIFDRASRNIPSGQSALKVWDELILVYEHWTRYFFCFPFLDCLDSSLSRTKFIDYYSRDLFIFENSLGRNKLIHQFFHVIGYILPSEYPLISGHSDSEEFSYHIVQHSVCSLADFLVNGLAVEGNDVESGICIECKNSYLIHAQVCYNEIEAEEQGMEQEFFICHKLNADNTGISDTSIISYEKILNNVHSENVTAFPLEESSTVLSEDFVAVPSDEITTDLYEETVTDPCKETVTDSSHEAAAVSPEEIVVIPSEKTATDPSHKAVTDPSDKTTTNPFDDTSTGLFDKTTIVSSEETAFVLCEEFAAVSSDKTATDPSDRTTFVPFDETATDLIYKTAIVSSEEIPTYKTATVSSDETASALFDEIFTVPSEETAIVSSGETMCEKILTVPFGETITVSGEETASVPPREVPVWLASLAAHQTNYSYEENVSFDTDYYKNVTKYLISYANFNSNS